MKSEGDSNRVLRQALRATEARADEAVRERDEAREEAKNLEVHVTARANSLLAMRDALINARDDLEDEGDRVYFGSTNDADAFKATVDDLDGWAWNDIMAEGKREDVFAACRNANARATAAEAENTRLRAALALSDRPCTYCTLPADKWAECAHGFPGCDRADDAMGCPELGARMDLHAAEAEVARLREALAAETEACAKIAERYAAEDASSRDRAPNRELQERHEFARHTSFLVAAAIRARTAQGGSDDGR